MLRFEAIINIHVRLYLTVLCYASVALGQETLCSTDADCTTLDQPFCLGGYCKAPYCPGDESLGPTPQAKRGVDGRIVQCTLQNAQVQCDPCLPPSPTVDSYYCETLERGFCCPNTKNPRFRCPHGARTMAGALCSTYGPFDVRQCLVGSFCSGRPGHCCTYSYSLSECPKEYGPHGTPFGTIGLPSNSSTAFQ